MPHFDIQDLVRLSENSPRKAMGKAEKSSDSAYSKEVGFERRHP